MHIPSPHFDSTYLIYAGAIGILLGLVSFLLFLYHRIRWIIGALSKKQAGSMRLLASLRNLLLITVWISIFGMVIFFGFFLRAYHVFNIEEPVAEVFAQSLPGAAFPDCLPGDMPVNLSYSGQRMFCLSEFVKNVFSSCKMSIEVACSIC